LDSQVTTKIGDEGTTRTLGGDTLSKSHPIVEANGALDSLRAQLALLRLVIMDRNPVRAEDHTTFIWWLMHLCFLAGAEISDPLWKHHASHPGKIGPEHLAKLEAEQARLEQMTPLPHAFIVSAANVAAAAADVTATVARQFERRLVALHEAVPEFACGDLLIFANRLSDFLFILARHLDDGRFQTVDYNAAMP
jgi:cob(I)alamin adenosyltransferase